jgi:hypothetical protein
MQTHRCFAQEVFRTQIPRIPLLAETDAVLQ